MKRPRCPPQLLQCVGDFVAGYTTSFSFAISHWAIVNENTSFGPTRPTFGTTPLNRAPAPSSRSSSRRYAAPDLWSPKGLFWIRVLITSIGDENTIEQVPP